ncbi:MAG: Gfo/Idh/MocA family oxidoreductase [Chitinophagaceae bacterium]
MIIKVHKVCIVGGGNISNTRHIPALKKTGRADVVGVIGISEKHILRTLENNNKIKNSCVFEDIDQLSKLGWLNEVDSVVIGTPPRDHFKMARTCLELDKHVLLEKPFTMNTGEAETLIELAKSKNKVLAVMHNFQYANNFIKLEKLVKEGVIGEVYSFNEIQYSNKTRRLPVWYNELPLGLFYDEAPHFIYLLQKLGGEIEIQNVFRHADPDPERNTPVLLNVNLKAGGIPANIFINFNSPVCEWLFIVSGSTKLAIYDLFRDILITIPNDGLHLAKNVLSNSLHTTIKHWMGNITNGFRVLTGNLLYGQDRVMHLYFDMIDQHIDVPEINGYSGWKNVRLLNEIAHLTTLT